MPRQVFTVTRRAPLDSSSRLNWFFWTKPLARHRWVTLRGPERLLGLLRDFFERFCGGVARRTMVGVDRMLN